MTEEPNLPSIEGTPEAGLSRPGEETVEATILSPERSVESVAEMVSAQPSAERSPLPSVSQPTPSDDDAVVAADAKSVYDETDAEARVTKLISLAETRGVEYAVRIARKLDDFYVLDRMHDALSGKFYDALKAKGMIAE